MALRDQRQNSFGWFGFGYGNQAHIRAWRPRDDKFALWRHGQVRAVFGQT